MSQDYVNIRFNVSKDAHEVYKILTSSRRDAAEHRPFSTMKDAFMAAACLGAKENKYEVPSAVEGVFSGSVLDPDVDVPVLMALAFARTGDINLLLDAREVAAIAQGWAEGGIWLLKQALLDSPGSGAPLFTLTDIVQEEASAMF